MLNAKFTQQDEERLFDLIALISDPKAAKARLDEIKEATAKNVEAAKQASSVVQEAREALAKADKAGVKVADDMKTLALERVEVEKMRSETRSTKASYDRMGAALAEREKLSNNEMAVRSAELDAREASVRAAASSSEKMVAAREAAAEKLEADAKAALASAESLKKDYEQKLRALRVLASS